MATTTPPRATEAVAPEPEAPPRLWGRHALAGFLAAMAALAATELVSGILNAGSTLILGVGNLVIDNVPEGIERWAIQVFGTNDKPALVIGIVLLSGLFGAVLGLAAARRPWIGIAGFVAFGLIGVYAASQDPLLSSSLGIIAAAIGAGVGIAVLTGLLAAAATQETPAVQTDSTGLTRRGFFALAGAVAILAAGGAGIAKYLMDRTRVRAASRAEVALPPARSTIAPPPPAASLDVEGISPLITSNADFYRIDTALTVPIVDLETWRLKIHGLVDRPYELSFEDLMDQPLEEEYVTLACVSNPVGGDLVGNAKWRGVRLSRLLEAAGVQDGASQIVGRSVDGFTVGFPTEVAFDGRDAFVAIGMNDQPLPFDHGFPARLVVAGLYGYVSATKWLSDIELTRYEDFDGYWIPRGWSKQGPIKTQSRIDVPAVGGSIPPGNTAIAGVAFAPTRGISQVEVRIDNEPWRQAVLSAPLNSNTWVQWSLDWDAGPGRHNIQVRATDGTGATQVEERTPVAPNGATGYHTRSIVVREA